MPVGIFSCTQRLDCLHCIFQAAGEKYFYPMRVGQLSLCSEVLLLSFGVPPMPPPACFTLSHSHDSKVWRVLATTDVGNVTQGFSHWRAEGTP